jgi:hypothetical protein
MMNVPGDAKPREVVEDTAVAVEDLPAYIAEFDALMRNKYGISSVYYAHAGAGELHTRPLFDLKTPEGMKFFRGIATDVAHLVKKYRGSLSGEHGDGRLRGEFIPFMVGPECYAMMRRVKETFDPRGLFNPGKIIDTPPMDTSLRHGPDHPSPEAQDHLQLSRSAGRPPRRREMQRCRRVPQDPPHGRHHVPELHGDAQRAGHHPRQGQHAPPRPHRRPRGHERLGQRAGEGRHGPLPLLQGLQIRVPLQR